MTEALTTTRSNWMQPTTFEEADKLSKYLASKGISVIPKAYANDPGAVLVSIAIGEGYGLSPVQSLQLLHVIHGKVGMDATLIRARAMSHEDCEYFVIEDATVERALVRVRRKSWEKGITQTVEVTLEDAKRAKWGMRGGSWDSSSSWVKTPDDMLVARATSKAARRYFPELFTGVYEMSEVRDIVEVEATVLPDQPEEPPAVGKLDTEALKPVSSEEVPSEPVALGDALAEGLKDVPHETTTDAAEPAPNAPLTLSPALQGVEAELEAIDSTKNLRTRLTELLPSVDWVSVKPHRLIPEALRHLAEGEPVEDEPEDQPSQGSGGDPPGEPSSPSPDAPAPPAPEEDVPPPPEPDDLEGFLDAPEPAGGMANSIELRDKLLGYIDASTSTSDLDNVTKDMNVCKGELFLPHLRAVKRAWSEKREELK